MLKPTQPRTATDGMETLLQLVVVQWAAGSGGGLPDGRGRVNTAAVQLAACSGICISNCNCDCDLRLLLHYLCFLGEI